MGALTLDACVMSLQQVWGIGLGEAICLREKELCVSKLCFCFASCVLKKGTGNLLVNNLLTNNLEERDSFCLQLRAVQVEVPKGSLLFHRFTKC